MDKVGGSRGTVYGVLGRRLCIHGPVSLLASHDARGVRMRPPRAQRPMSTLRLDCQVQRYYALMVQDYNAPQLDSVPPMVPTHAAGACEEINGCSRRMPMYWYA